VGSLNTCPKCRALLEPGTRRCPYCNTDVRHLDALSPGEQVAATSQFGVWVLTLNVAFYLLTVFLDPTGGDPEKFLEPTNLSLDIYGASHPGLNWICGHYWRLLTAVFLHANLLHLAFNSVAVFFVLPLAAGTFGVYRTIVLYLVTGVAGFLASSLLGGNPSVGASGAICGLIGALLVWGHRRGGAAGNELKRRMAMWALFILVYGFVYPRIDNWGHGGGFVSGLALGWVAARLYVPGGREDRAWRLASIISVVVLVAVVAGWQVPSIVRGFERRDVELHRNTVRRTLELTDKVLTGQAPPERLPDRLAPGAGAPAELTSAVDTMLRAVRTEPGSDAAVQAYVEAVDLFDLWRDHIACRYLIFRRGR
jgi:rhomboid protease GluP